MRSRSAHGSPASALLTPSWPDTRSRHIAGDICRPPARAPSGVHHFCQRPPEGAAAPHGAGADERCCFKRLCGLAQERRSEELRTLPQSSAAKGTPSNISVESSGSTIHLACGIRPSSTRVTFVAGHRRHQGSTMGERRAGSGHMPGRAAFVSIRFGRLRIVVRKQNGNRSPDARPNRECRKST